LSARGYRIIERNVRFDGVEIDLLIRSGSTVAFVEVKTRSSGLMGPPELAVDAHKQARIVRAARAWLLENPRASRAIRFDVVSCRVYGDGSQRQWKLEHLRDAFRAGD
jgi:putative endonuclease